MHCCCLAHSDVLAPPYPFRMTTTHAGALPDQLVFSKDCKTILVSNEGEPATYEPASLANDPEGSVSVINLHFCEGVDHIYTSSVAEGDSATVAAGPNTAAHKSRRMSPKKGSKKHSENK